MFQKIKDLPRSISQGFKSLWLWLPIICKDRNWDHQYIYIVLRHKLHLTEQLIRHHGHHVHRKRDADQIKVCINLLDRLIEDEYFEMAFKKHYEKWGHPDLSWRDSEEHKGMCVLNIDYPNVKTDEDKNAEKKDFKFASTHEAKQREQDLDLLFKLMRKHIQGWWD